MELIRPSGLLYSDQVHFDPDFTLLLLHILDQVFDGRKRKLEYLIESFAIADITVILLREDASNQSNLHEV